MSKRSAILILSGTIIVLTLLIVTDCIPFLRGPAPDSSQWHWPYSLRPFSGLWAVILTAVFLVILFNWWIRYQTNKWQTFLVLAGLAVGSLLMQFSLVHIDRPEFFSELIDRTLAINSNGYFRTASETDDIDFLLRNFPSAMLQFETEHARTHPPGLILINWLTIKLFALFPGLSEILALPVLVRRCTDLWLLNQPPPVMASLGFLAIVPPMFAAFLVFPIYKFTNQLGGTNKAKLAAAFTTTIPALLLFVPLPDQIFALLALLIVMNVHNGITLGETRYLLAAGFIFSISTFLSLGNGAFFLAIGLYATFYIWKNPVPLSEAFRWGIAFLIGASTIWLAYWIGWGVPPWQIADVGIAQHYELVTRERPYGWWVLYNLVDLVLFAGFPIIIGFFSLTLSTLHYPTNKQAPHHLLALSLLIFILVLNLSGTVKGEVGRLWIFFMPLMAIIAAIYYADYWPNFQHLPILVGLQLLLTIGLGTSWKVVDAVIVTTEKPASQQNNTPSYSKNVELGEHIIFTGYDINDLTITWGEELNLTLYWKSEGPTLHPYTVFTHIIDSNGHIIAQQDNWPVNGRWPSTCWQKGEVIVDPYHYIIPGDLASGEYSIRIGMYDAQNNTRLVTNDGRDAIILPQTLVNQ